MLSRTATTCTGWAATPSAPRTWRERSTSSTIVPGAACVERRPARLGAGAGAARARCRLLRSSRVADPHRVIDFLAFDGGNPSSILSCLRSARENARAVRGSISSEMWETFNSTWLEARAQAPTRFTALNVASS